MCIRRPIWISSRFNSLSLGTNGHFLLLREMQPCIRILPFNSNSSSVQPLIISFNSRFMMCILKLNSPIAHASRWRSHLRSVHLEEILSHIDIIIQIIILIIFSHFFLSKCRYGTTFLVLHLWSSSIFLISRIYLLVSHMIHV
uniref:Uncharacterized protein MANES_13G019800 n=1 Tax=Rhizophora mucronata TaxID=61149 RepID=A0A2P2KXH0_RHIMU